MVKKKTKTKRLTVHLKDKITKKITQHHKKLRQIARDNVRKGIKHNRKDPGVPNLWPFKEKVLLDIQEHQLKEEEKKSLKRELNKKKQKAAVNSVDKLQELVNSATERSEKYESTMESDETLETFFQTKEKIAGDNNRRTYFHQLKSVLEQADTILEIIDARDPMGCRSKWLEDKILSIDSSKKIILVMNKIDLVPKDVVTSWLAILRKDFPTIAFRACTSSGNRIGRAATKGEHATEGVLSSSKGIGCEQLMELLKNYSRSGDMKTAITVGVIGYPNVGKSSLINSMKRSRSVGVSSTPGFTKTIQEVQLDSKIKLIDSPGVIFNDDRNDTNFLRNCISVSAVEDPEAIVEKVLHNLNTEFLMEHYNIAAYSNSTEFLWNIAHRLGKLLSGGIPDKKAAAKMVIQDWNSGKVPFYVNPPIIETETGMEIVAEGDEEFDLSRKDKLLLEEENVMNVGKKYAILPNTEMELD